MSEVHVSASELVELLGQRVEGARRDALEAHLAGCRPCRAALAAALRADAEPTVPQRAPAWLRARARNLVGSGRLRGAWWPLAPAGRVALAASVVAAAGLAGWWLLTPVLAPPAPAIRGAGEALPEPEPLHPAPGAAIVAETIVFRWREVPDALSYTLSLLDATGDIILERSTPTPELTVAVASIPAGRERLFWTVRASLEDGAAVESAPARLLWRRP